jgi:hypothetical protein
MAHINPAAPPPRIRASYLWIKRSHEAANIPDNRIEKKSVDNEAIVTSSSMGSNRFFADAIIWKPF